jgi:hypothetical protein
MLERPLRQVATQLLEAGIRIAPSEVRDWGQAMLSELHYIENGWAGLSWAFGSTVVLAKHALISLLIATRRQRIVSDGGLFARSVSVRKAALVASAACTLGALLFFAAPPFRQGLRVSLGAWNAMFHVTGQTGQRKLLALAQRAEARHDPEGLVFAATQITDAGRSARLADEAVRLDPSLLWAYAVVAVGHPQVPEIQQWLPKLQRWDSRNALFHLIAAESIHIDQFLAASNPSPNERQKRLEDDSAWQKAMASAFASLTYNDYVPRLDELDQRVARRYGFDDPQELLGGDDREPATLEFSYTQRYAKFLVQSGESLESRGDWKGAAEKFWTVARFGQVMDSQAHTDIEHWVGTALPALAYTRLRVLADIRGNPRQATLFAYLGKKFDPVTVEREMEREWVFGSYISRRNAAVLQISSFAMLLFSAVLIVAASILIARRYGREILPPSSPGMTVLALISAPGVLLSSATLYLTYRPYWYIFQGAILKGETNQTEDLRSFLEATRTLPGLRPYGGQLLYLPVYFWTGVALVAVAALMLILLRHFRQRARLTPVQPYPRVP